MAAAVPRPGGAARRATTDGAIQIAYLPRGTDASFWAIYKLVLKTRFAGPGPNSSSRRRSHGAEGRFGPLVGRPWPLQRAAYDGIDPGAAGDCAAYCGAPPHVRPRSPATTTPCWVGEIVIRPRPRPTSPAPEIVSYFERTSPASVGRFASTLVEAPRRNEDLCRIRRPDARLMQPIWKNSYGPLRDVGNIRRRVSRQVCRFAFDCCCFLPVPAPALVQGGPCARPEPARASRRVAN